jgi:hypothetical protein
MEKFCILVRLNCYRREDLIGLQQELRKVYITQNMRGLIYKQVEFDEVIQRRT